MSTIRQRAKAAKSIDKKVVKPVLTSPFALAWPVLSSPAQAQIEAALWKLLQPIAETRNNQYSHVEADSPEVGPHASTSQVTLETTQAGVLQPSDNNTTAQEAFQPGHMVPTPASKRAKRRIKALKKLEGRDAHLDPNMHELSLRSGAVVKVPNRPTPSSFTRILRLDKGKAIETRPKICDSLVVGLNANTRHLELGIASARQRLAGSTKSMQEMPQMTSQAVTNLRLTIPAPTRGTRRDRRSLRNMIHPAGKVKLRTFKHDLASAPEFPMPTHLGGIERGDAVLVYTLQDIKGRLQADPAAPSARQSLKDIEATLKVLEECGKDEDCAMADDGGGQAPPEGQADKLAQIPTNLVCALISTGSAITDDERSIVVSLLLRHDPAWFRAKAAYNNWHASREKLQSIARASRKETKPQPSVKGTPPAKPLEIVFVAKGDINPSHMVEHLVTAVAAQNSLYAAQAHRRRDDGQDQHGQSMPNDVYLVPLSRGAEVKLANLLALRRVSVLGLTNSDEPDYTKLLQLVKSHLPTPLAADWLAPATNHLLANYLHPTSLLPTHVKHLQSTVVVGAKLERAQETVETQKQGDANAQRSDRKRQRSNSVEEGQVG